MGTMLLRRRLLVGVSVALLISACGTTGAKDGTTGPGSIAPSADAQERAEAANITADDFPSGWTATPMRSNDTDDLLRDCAPALHLEDVAIATAVSDRFRQGTADVAVQFSSVSRVFDSEGSAHQVMKTFGQASLRDCVNLRMKGVSSSPLEGSFEPSMADMSYGDEAAGIDGALIAKDSSGKTAKIEIRLLAIRTGDLVTIFTGSAAGMRMSDERFSGLASKITERQQN